MRLLALAAALLLAAPAPGRGGEEGLRPTTAGAAAGGAVWIGPRPRGAARRIVSLAPSLTDTLIALGDADRIVGVTRLDRSPEVAGAARVGGFLDPDPEAILAARPDLVLWVTDGGALPAIRRTAELAHGAFAILALPVVSVADVIAEARLVGDAVGDRAAGEALARRAGEALERLRARGARGAHRRVLFVVGQDPLVVAGPGSFPDEILRLAGLVNVVGGDRPWPVYPVELAIAADPELVIDAAIGEPPGGMARLAAIPAVARGAVVRLPDDGLLRPGPRMFAALDRLLDALPAGARR